MRVRVMCSVSSSFLLSSFYLHGKWSLSKKLIFKDWNLLDYK